MAIRQALDYIVRGIELETLVDETSAVNIEQLPRPSGGQSQHVVAALMPGICPELRDEIFRYRFHN